MLYHNCGRISEPGRYVIGWPFSGSSSSARGMKVILLWWCVSGSCRKTPLWMGGRGARALRASGCWRRLQYNTHGNFHAGNHTASREQIGEMLTHKVSIVLLLRVGKAVHIIIIFKQNTILYSIQWYPKRTKEASSIQNAYEKMKIYAQVLSPTHT